MAEFWRNTCHSHLLRVMEKTMAFHRNCESKPYLWYLSFHFKFYKWYSHVIWPISHFQLENNNLIRLSKEMADRTHQLRYIMVVKELSFIVSACTNFDQFTRQQADKGRGTRRTKFGGIAETRKNAWSWTYPCSWD